MVVGFQIIFSLIILLPFLENSNINQLSILMASTGAWVFTSVGWFINLPEYILTSFYTLGIFLLLFLTFRDKNVKIIFPIFYLIIALVSVYLSHNFWTHFS